MTDLWDRTRECFVCGAPYKERDNFGKWRCKEHPGALVNGRFTCCGLVTGPHRTVEAFYRANTIAPHMRGCIHADHRQKIEPHSRKGAGVEVTELHVKHLGIDADRLHESGTEIRCYRFDYRAHRRVIARALRAVTTLKK